jgi:hypothetical protein
MDGRDEQTEAVTVRQAARLVRISIRDQADGVVRHSPRAG